MKMRLVESNLTRIPSPRPRKAIVIFRSIRDGREFLGDEGYMIVNKYLGESDLGSVFEIDLDADADDYR